MAKAAAISKLDNGAAGKRTFSFLPSFSVPVPDVSRAPRADQLPFKGLYSEDAKAALEGKQPHRFIPHAYWSEERGTPKDKVNGGFAKAKLRDQFRQWQAADKTREGIALIAVERTGKEDIEGINEPGTSIWLVKAA